VAQTRGQSIVGEFEGISLGDKRLERRLSTIVAAMEDGIAPIWRTDLTA
jgi:hypothetical protein